MIRICWWIYGKYGVYDGWFDNEMLLIESRIKVFVWLIKICAVGTNNRPFFWDQLGFWVGKDPDWNNNVFRVIWGIIMISWWVYGKYEVYNGWFDNEMLLIESRINVFVWLIKICAVGTNNRPFFWNV